MSHVQDETNSSAQGSEPTALPVPTESAQSTLPKSESTQQSLGSGPTSPDSAAPVQSGNEYRVRFAEETHQYIREYIRMADQKATFFFTGATALLAFLYKQNVSAHWLKPVNAWSLMDGVAFIAMAALSVSAFLAMLVVIPRTPGSKRGLIFWEAIAAFENGRRYSEELSALTTSALFQEKAEHCHVLAVVCRRKYAHLRTALRIGAAGLAASLVVFLFT